MSWVKVVKINEYYVIAHAVMDIIWQHENIHALWMKRMNVFNGSSARSFFLTLPEGKFYTRDLFLL